MKHLAGPTAVRLDVCVVTAEHTTLSVMADCTEWRDRLEALYGFLSAACHGTGVSGLVVVVAAWFIYLSFFYEGKPFIGNRSLPLLGTVANIGWAVIRCGRLVITECSRK